jgi:Putative DNA-binding domain
MHVPSLRELQRDLMHALLDGGAERAAPLPAALIPARGMAPAHALNVYANTARTNFIDSLILSYPVIRRLVGEDYFLQAARGFHTGHPSLSGDLQPAGTQFAQYVSHLHRDDDYRYLGDVARLEWLVQETLLAADHEPFDLRKLGLVPPTDYDDLRFHLHPTARLFASEFPCLAIWEANVGGDTQPPLIDLGAGPDRLLLLRQGGELKFHRLSEGEQGFLQSVQAGERFAAAVENGARRGEIDAAHGPLASAGRFDAAAALQRFVIAGGIVDFH